MQYTAIYKSLRPEINVLMKLKKKSFFLVFIPNYISLFHQKRYTTQLKLDDI